MPHANKCCCVIGRRKLEEAGLNVIALIVPCAQVLDLVEDVEQYDREKPLVVAKNIGGREMAASVQSKLRLLKVTGWC